MIGFVLGYDSEEASPDVIKRVPVSAYAKVLMPPEALLQPSIENMTPTVRQLYEAIFATQHPPNAA